MANITLMLEKGLSDTDVQLALLMSEHAQTFQSWKYDPATGATEVVTRSFMPFGELEPESEQSKLVNQLVEDIQKQTRLLQRDHEQLDLREAQALARERALDEKVLEHERDVAQLAGERAEFERLQATENQGGVVGRIKSFFHRIN